MKRIRVGIFFGGPSREREISFAGGRTVYDNLNKSLFEPIPIFVDSNRKFIHLDWEYIYKGTIRDFYPPVKFIPKELKSHQIYIESLQQVDTDTYSNLTDHVGKEVIPTKFKELFDIAFLTLHGEFGEDGQIQSILDMHNIPYTGSGVLPCAIGIDKSVQKTLMEKDNFNTPNVIVIKRNSWLQSPGNLYNQSLKEIKFPLVIRPANQGSSIGVSILTSDDPKEFNDAIDKAFFIKNVNIANWNILTTNAKYQFIQSISDIRDGLGFPIQTKSQILYDPDTLLNYLNQSTKSEEVLFAVNSEHTVIVESFIHGREFSCIVIKDEKGNSIALPPTEILKNSKLYDYKSKYLPGLSRKITPIDTTENNINNIRKECCRLFEYLGFHTYARIDGFLCNDGSIFLNDPNTTSGMLPSSFFFHQAAEIGLNPSQFLTYIIRTSLDERIQTSLSIGEYENLLVQLDKNIATLQSNTNSKIKVGVILGGYSFERHISVESGRNIYEKLASSDKYEPIPLFLSGNEKGFELYQIPINLLLKDNADDIRDKIENYSTHSIIDDIRSEARDIMQKYSTGINILKPVNISFEDLKDLIDVAFIALHGRPGEDGSIQQKLDEYRIPYNGSPVESSKITINKYDTLQLLSKNDFIVANQALINKTQYLLEQESTLTEIESKFNYPLIAKPVDDGCSSAVLKIADRTELSSYLDAIFREQDALSISERKALKIDLNDEFPKKEIVLIEELIQAEGCKQFMEVTVGLVTEKANGRVEYTVFEPSEALSSGSILSLEEKFLAGEGQNITPARFGSSKSEYDLVALQVKKDIERAARLLKVEGYARIDAFVRIFEEKVETIIIEVNSLPGMTPATCIFHQAAILEYKPLDFIDSILDYGIKRNKED